MDGNWAAEAAQPAQDVPPSVVIDFQFWQPPLEFFEPLFGNVGVGHEESFEVFETVEMFETGIGDGCAIESKRPEFC